MQSAGGAGFSTSVIRKSPSGSSGTPAGFVLCWVKGAVGFTDWRREDAEVGGGANWVASSQQQAPAGDADIPIGLHGRFESGNHPG